MMGKNNQICRVLRDEKWHLIVVDVRSFRGADLCLVVVKVRRICLQINKQPNVERFQLKKVNVVEVKG
jgi:hypothetical protein